VHGLINLRGQISTAVDLRNLFDLDKNTTGQQMNVVCRINDLLLSFLVDKIGDVMEISDKAFEPTPDVVPQNIQRFMEGVYKIPGTLLSIIEIQKLSEVITASVNNSNPENKE
jgi:purine-binding chemotaxis protein CheW